MLACCYIKAHLVQYNKAPGPGWYKAQTKRKNYDMWKINKSKEKPITKMKNQNFIMRTAGGPFAGFLAVMGGILLGIHASATVGNLQKSAPVTWIESFPQSLSEAKENWSDASIFFWTLFFAVSLLVVLRELHNHAQRKIDHDALTENIEAVQEVAATMPPKSHLQKMALDYEDVNFESEILLSKADVIFKKSNSISSQEIDGLYRELNKTIRGVLDSVINLAIHFDQPHLEKGARYSANIMWVKSPDDFTYSGKGELWEAAERLSNFDNQDSFFGYVHRVLVLDLNLATNSDTYGTPIVDNLSPLCLAYKGGDAGKGYNLPGAPQALASMDMSYIPDTIEIAGQLFNYGDGPKEKVSFYYTQDRRANSILSMPIKGFDPATASEEIIGVISIYRDSPNIMNSQERAAMFYYQMIPSYLSLLYRLCWMRRETEPNGHIPFEVYTDDESNVPTGEGA